MAAQEKVTPIRPVESAGENVWTALCKAQAEFTAIGKSATGARASEKYAPLDEVLDVLRPLLTKHGLASSSLPYVEAGHMMLRRKLVHGLSQTEIELNYPVASIERNPRELGSALTYARRYSLLAICDVHPSNEDDDGQSAGQGAPRARVQTPAQDKQESEGDKAAERMRAWLVSKHGLLKACETPKEVHATWKVIEDSPKWQQIMAAMPTDAIGLRTYKDNLLKNWSAGEALNDEIPF